MRAKDIDISKEHVILWKPYFLTEDEPKEGDAGRLPPPEEKEPVFDRTTRGVSQPKSLREPAY